MLRSKALLLLFCVVGAAASCEGVTEQEFKDLLRVVSELRAENKDLSAKMKTQTAIIDELKTEIKRQAILDDHMSVRLTKLEDDAIVGDDVFETSSTKDFAQNTTLEERVSFLEAQVSDLNGNVEFLFDSQLIQDDRLFSLEQANIGINQDIDEIEDYIEELQVSAVELEFRVTVLEENGGGDGDSSISELEERVETLEGTAAEQEIRIDEAENELSGLGDSTIDLDNRVTVAEGEIDDQEVRLTSTEENIEALQTTDVTLDERITALEENGVGSSDIIAFDAVLTDYFTIGEGDTVQFNEVITNEGNGYNRGTGVFTVPSTGDGLYHLSAFVLVDNGEDAKFDIRVNDEVVCTAVGDQSSNDDDDFDGVPQSYRDVSQGSCSAAVDLGEGDEVKVVYVSGRDLSPLATDSGRLQTGFTGFRI